VRHIGAAVIYPHSIRKFQIIFTSHPKPRENQHCFYLGTNHRNSSSFRCDYPDRLFRCCGGLAVCRSVFCDVRIPDCKWTNLTIQSTRRQLLRTNEKGVRSSKKVHFFEAFSSKGLCYTSTIFQDCAHSIVLDRISPHKIIATVCAHTGKRYTYSANRRHGYVALNSLGNMTKLLVRFLALNFIPS